MRAVGCAVACKLAPVMPLGMTMSVSKRSKGWVAADHAASALGPSQASGHGVAGAGGDEPGGESDMRFVFDEENAFALALRRDGVGMDGALACWEPAH